MPRFKQFVFKFNFPCISFLVLIGFDYCNSPKSSDIQILLVFQMENYPSYADEADRSPISWISSSANVNTYPPTSSIKVQAQKRQRKPSKKATATKSNVQSQWSSRTHVDSSLVPDYQPSLAQAYHTPTFSPFWNISQMPQLHQQLMQRTPIPTHFPFNPYTQWLPPLTLSPTTTSQSYSQYNQQQETPRTIPAVQSTTSTTFYRDPSLPTVMSNPYSQSQFGATESKPQSPRFDLNYSPTYSSSLPDLEALRSCQWEGGTMSAFEIYKRSPTGEFSDVKLEQSHDQSKPTSTTSNSPYLTHAANEDDNSTNGESTVNDRGDDKKSMYPSSVVDEKYDFTCVICQETKKDTVLIPCRHLCVCENCCKDIELCPLCREPVEKIMTVFT